MNSDVRPLRQLFCSTKKDYTCEMVQTQYMLKMSPSVCACNTYKEGPTSNLSGRHIETWTYLPRKKNQHLFEQVRKYGKWIFVWKMKTNRSFKSNDKLEDKSCTMMSMSSKPSRRKQIAKRSLGDMIERKHWKVDDVEERRKVLATIFFWFYFILLLYGDNGSFLCQRVMVGSWSQSH